MLNIIRAVQHCLQPVDTLSEQQRGKAGGNTNKKGDEPEGDLSRSLMPQNAPPIAGTAND